MRRTGPVHPPYLSCFAAQLGTIGRRGQQRLHDASVLIVGAGGVGTAIALTLAGAGVGKLVVDDPQKFSLDNFNRAVFARPRDIGRLKADVLAGFFLGRPHLTVVPVSQRAEALGDVPDARMADVVVAASNTMNSRLAVAKFAYETDRPQVSAGLTDGRQALGGLITEWTPKDPEAACPACFLSTGGFVPRGESLFAPAVSILGALAAWRTIRFLLDRPDRRSNAANCTAVNLDAFAFESFRVLRRTDCSVCSLRSRDARRANRHG